MDGERAERKRKYEKISVEEDDDAGNDDNIDSSNFDPEIPGEEIDDVDDDQNDTSMILDSTLDVTGIVGAPFRGRSPISHFLGFIPG